MRGPERLSQRYAARDEPSCCRNVAIQARGFFRGAKRSNMFITARMALLCAIFCLLSIKGNAQIPVQFKPNKGLVIGTDTGNFKLNLRFRIQNRFALLSEDGDDLNPTGSDIRVRRMRLRLEGHVLSPRLKYKIQLGFSKGDLDLIETTTAQPIRDAAIYYDVSKHWRIGIGQDKLPGNRQRVVSSGALQLPDRSIVNATFTLDRDMGFFATWKGGGEHSPLFVKTAITSGEGRNASPGNEGLCYTGRVEWLPLGEFTNEGDYFEGDLEREPKPRLSVAAGYSTNQSTRRAGGQLGEVFPGVEERTMNVFISDLLLKYKGWAFTTEFCQRDVDGEAMVLSDEHVVTIFEGWGSNTQVSRMVGTKGYELVARYSLVEPSARLSLVQSKREEAWFGCTRYINHHRVKVQSAVSYAWRNGLADLAATGNRWGLWFQMELGL